MISEVLSIVLEMCSNVKFRQVLENMYRTKINVTKRLFFKRIVFSRVSLTHVLDKVAKYLPFKARYVRSKIN